MFLSYAHAERISAQHSALLWRPNGTSSKKRSSNVRNCITMMLYLGWFTSLFCMMSCWHKSNTDTYTASLMEFILLKISVDHLWLLFPLLHFPRLDKELAEEGSLSLPLPGFLLKIRKINIQPDVETQKFHNSLFFRDFQENLLNCYQAHQEWTWSNTTLLGSGNLCLTHTIWGSPHIQSTLP